ncbi:MAG: uracil-DNA glycosylase [Streptobacillus sp.]
MELILESSLKYDFNITDLAIDPLNSNIILTGDSLNFLSDNKIIKSIKSSMKNSMNLRFIKYQDQLFQSNDFYVISNLNLHKISGSKKKKIEEIDLNILDRFTENIQVTSAGDVVYISNNVLYSYNIESKDIKSYSLRDLGQGIYKMYLSGDNVLIKHRKNLENNIKILIFNIKKLEKIIEIDSNINQIYSKIIGYNFLASTDDGSVELWDILEGEVKASYNISEYKITYIDNDEDNKYYYFGNSVGDLIITDIHFNIVKVEKVFKSEIKKIVPFNSKIYVLSHDNKIKVYKKIQGIEENLIDDFMNKYNVDESYRDFFNIEKVSNIQNFINNLNFESKEYTPSEEKIFRALEMKIEDIKVCILGKDPYFQKGVATGLAFEVNKNSWNDESINTSLKNILKLIYKTYTGEIKDINYIRKMIENNKFKILAPSLLFENWMKQGVLLLNSSLTTLVGSAGMHHKFWTPIIKELIEYISSKNNNITYLLWGNDAIIFEKNILNGNIVKHNHPAIVGKLDNPNDFMNGKSFEATKDIINWKGI